MYVLLGPSIFGNQILQVSERELDLVLDHVYELNADTPKVKVHSDPGLAPDLVFGIDTQLFSTKSDSHHLVEPEHHYREVDLIDLTALVSENQAGFTREQMEETLKLFDKDIIYRIKGFIRIDGQVHILNWAFGRYTLDECSEGMIAKFQDTRVKLTVMGIDLSMYVNKIRDSFCVSESESKLTIAHRH